ncbi:hypothetical protein P7C70_g2241, partial [Phenoliferia sp. Uapishka_3]
MFASSSPTSSSIPTSPARPSEDDAEMSLTAPLNDSVTGAAMISQTPSREGKKEPDTVSLEKGTVTTPLEYPDGGWRAWRLFEDPRVGFGWTVRAVISFAALTVSISASRRRLWRFPLNFDHAQGTPISGAIITSQNGSYDGAAYCSGAMVLAGTGTILAARQLMVRRKGTQWV